MARFRREMDTLFDRFIQDPWSSAGFDFPFAGLTSPRTDLADAKNEVTVAMELPGVRPEDVNISIAGDVLTVRGEKRDHTEQKDKNFHFTERRFGGFQRSVQLPSTVDPDKVNAKFDNGVLTVAIAKRPEAEPRRIKVRDA